MADLLKKSKRGGYLPRVAGSAVWTGEKYAEQETPRGEMPPMLYTLGVGVGDEEYELRLTEDQMIAATGEWLSKLASRRAREKLHAKRSAANGS